MNLTLSNYYNSKTRIVWHITFWLVLVLYHSIIYSMYSGDFGSELMWEGIALPVKMGATYFTLYFLLPRFFMNRRFIRFSLYAAVALLFAAFFQRLTEYTIINWFIDPFERAEVLLNPVKVLRAVIGIYPVVALAAFIKVGKHWYERDLESQELEKDKLEAELNFLKAQIHPHFLFNTLNNLYALTLKKSDNASEVVLKLSDLLNYMLYECNERKIPLEKELYIIQTYISLEKIRYGDRLNVIYDVTGKTAGKEISPLLLLPFVENSFKHGVSEQLDQAQIGISIEVNENQFNLKVENSMSDSATVDEKEFKEGIGLKNVQRRLDLLYDGQYNLEIFEDEEVFTVVLTLELDYPIKPEQL